MAKFHTLAFMENRRNEGQGRIAAHRGRWCDWCVLSPRPGEISEFLLTSREAVIFSKLIKFQMAKLTKPGERESEKSPKCVQPQIVAGTFRSPIRWIFCGSSLEIIDLLTNCPNFKCQSRRERAEATQSPTENMTRLQTTSKNVNV
jgi:hypothetical protein